MATEPKALSLALVLLETTSPDYGQEPKNVSHDQAEKYKDWRNKRDKQNDMASREKLRQVQVSLYKTLYQVIEDYGEAHNNALNMAIGKALALVIEDPGIGGERDPKLHEYIRRLVNVLKPVVTEAVDAADEVSKVAEVPAAADAVAEKKP